MLCLTRKTGGGPGGAGGRAGTGAGGGFCQAGQQAREAAAAAAGGAHFPPVPFTACRAVPLRLRRFALGGSFAPVSLQPAASDFLVGLCCQASWSNSCGHPRRKLTLSYIPTHVISSFAGADQAGVARSAADGAGGAEGEVLPYRVDRRRGLPLAARRRRRQVLGEAGASVNDTNTRLPCALQSAAMR